MVRKNITVKIITIMLLMALITTGISNPAIADNTERYDKSGQNVGNVNYNLAHFDGLGNIVWATSDKVKTSSITYATTALSFSRIVTTANVTSAADLGRNRSNMAKENWDYYDNSGSSVAWYKFNASERAASYYDTSKGEYRNKDNYTISFSNVVNAIEANNPAWAAEIKTAISTGQHYYIKVDSVMAVYHSGNLKSLGTKQLLGNYFSNTAINDATGYGILTEEGWANKDGLYTHFDIFIDLADLYSLEPAAKEEVIAKITAPPTEQVLYDDHLVTTDSNDPSGNSKSSGQTYEDYVHFAGGNANNEGYDAAQGVPSNKTMTGFAEAIPWYATTDIYARAVYRDYYPKYVYVWKGTNIGEKSYSGKADFPTSEDAMGQYVSIFNQEVDVEFQNIEGVYDERFDTFNNTGAKGTAEFVYHHPELGGDFARRIKLSGELKLDKENVTGQHDGRRHLLMNQNTGDFSTDEYILEYCEHTYEHNPSYIDLDFSPNDKEYVVEVIENEDGEEEEITAVIFDIFFPCEKIKTDISRIDRNDVLLERYENLEI